MIPTCQLYIERGGRRGILIEAEVTHFVACGEKMADFATTGTAVEQRGERMREPKQEPMKQHTSYTTFDQGMYASGALAHGTGNNNALMETFEFEQCIDGDLNLGVSHIYIYIYMEA